ncbi:MAG TPA: aminotransferase class I/II-fold pyridoxal phosphate-dependent enzyme [Mycobacterium sp.]|nr:aminotransferase class I/II-fold pyridoxal phosphate-dependent enzyme [Mycobacterium sp.]
MTSRRLSGALRELAVVRDAMFDADGTPLHPAVGLHWPDDEQRVTAVSVAQWAMARLANRADAGTGQAQPPASLPSIGQEGVGTSRAWAVLRDRVLASAAPTDHPRYLAFVAGAASVSSVIADMAVSAAGVYGGSELEAGAVVAAERAALRWLADMIGLPASAHGAFVSGGSMANLSALVVARDTARRRHGRQPSLIISGASAHSSIGSAARVMGCEWLTVGRPDGRLQPSALRAALDRADPADIVAVVATAGATNTGTIDRFDEIAELCARFGLWLHVDAAYGGAALLSERVRPEFAGIGSADSVTVDPHKWLFTPFDCAAVLYREPELARASHAQKAPYLDAVNEAHYDNPADYAVHLSRRARGLPLWMSLVAHGTDAYRAAVDLCLDLAGYAATQIVRARGLSLAAEPSLSVVVFRRDGWDAADYVAWSRSARERGVGLITPTTVHGEPALRFCFVNPETTNGDIDLVLDDISSHQAGNTGRSRTTGQQGIDG